MTENVKPILELKNIVKAYDANIALKNAGLTVYPGEIHALMGANGAGKSTMIKIIAGAHRPNDGEIIINGERVVLNNPRDALHKGIAVVYQELSLVPHLTVSENICLSVDSVGRGGRYNWAESDRIAAHALAKLGKAAEGINVHDKVSTLRADQMQMIEIARAVGQEASIVLLDEPTSSLNFEETENLFSVVRELAKHGIAIIFVSHRMNEIREICDRISILRDGVLVAEVKMAPFIVTLAMQGAAASLTKIIAGGNSQTITLTAFRAFNRGEMIPGVRNYIIYMIVIVIVMYLLLRKTLLGRWIYATGSNEEASRLIGIPVDRVKIICYCMSGFLSAVAALLGASRLMNVEVTSGVGMELDAIAAVCIGGASLSGGLGTAFGALVGTLLQKGINNGINLLGINSFWSGAVTGIVIVVSVYIGMVAGKSGKKLKK